MQHTPIPLLVEKEQRPGGVQLTFRWGGVFESYWVTALDAVFTDCSDLGAFPPSIQQEVNQTLVETLQSLNEKGATHG